MVVILIEVIETSSTEDRSCDLTDMTGSHPHVFLCCIVGSLRETYVNVSDHVTNFDSHDDAITEAPTLSGSGATRAANSSGRHLLLT